MDLKVRTSTYVQDNHRWLRSAHGTDAPDTVELDLALFTAGTHYPNGFIPSGITLGKVTANGKYGPYNDGLATGVEVMQGHLYMAVRVDPDNTTGPALGSILRHCKVDEARLPANHGLNAAGKVDVAGRIIYV